MEAVAEVVGRVVATVDARGRARVQTVNTEPSQTVQSDQPATDIRNILRQHGQVGILDQLQDVQMTYADISEFTDYADAMRLAKDAEFDFMKLPSKVREIFGHKVENWLDAAHDKEKRDALVAAGIVEAPQAVVKPTGEKNPAEEEATVVPGGTETPE